MVVHSFINSIEPPGSAEMSQMASSLWGRVGQPGDEGSHGATVGCRRVLASGMVISLGAPGAQYMPLIMQEAYGAICINAENTK